MNIFKYYTEKEIDSILEKISISGLSSLSESDKLILVNISNENKDIDVIYKKLEELENKLLSITDKEFCKQYLIKNGADKLRFFLNENIENIKLEMRKYSIQLREKYKL